MKIDKKTIFSLFIVILFLGSLFAMITFSDNTNNSGEDYVPIDTNQNLEFVNYTATIDANVGELFPQIIAAGRPLDFEETSINTKLLDVSGIKNKQIEFRPDADGKINLIITLNIVPDKKSEIIEGLKKLEIFETPEFYQFGLLLVPDKVVFTNDQNQEIEYEFIRANMEGILGMETLKGDNLSIVAYGTFRGTELIQSRGIEQVNNSNQFQMVVGLENFKIIEFKDKIYSQKNYTLDQLNKIEIENKIKEKYPNTSFEYQITKQLQIDTADKNQTEFENKLNTLKEEENFIVDYLIDQNTTTINFDNNITFEKYTEIISILEIANNKILEEPEVAVNIEFNYSEIDTLEIKNKLNDLELKFNILASVDTSEVIISGKKYNYQEPTTDVLLNYPEDLDKTEISLNAQGYYQRDNLLYLGLSK